MTTVASARTPAHVRAFIHPPCTSELYPYFSIQPSALSLITFTDLSLAFGHVPLFESAQLQIDSGERIALIGRNGSGKSSLLRVISGEVPPDTGNVWRAPGV